MKGTPQSSVASGAAIYYSKMMQFANCAFGTNAINASKVSPVYAAIFAGRGIRFVHLFSDYRIQYRVTDHIASARML